MKIIKDGGHRLFENDRETAAYVGEMLDQLRRRGMDAVRELSEKFDGWSPPSFELSDAQIAEAIKQCPAELVRDTEYCQANVRRFAEAQLATLRSLEIESRPGVWLGHRHIPVGSVGSYVPGGRYPMFGSAQMSIIPAKVAGVSTVVGLHAAGEGRRVFPGDDQRDEAGRCRSHLRAGRGAGDGTHGIRDGGGAACRYSLRCRQ